jgi:hypothetical protein
MTSSDSNSGGASVYPWYVARIVVNRVAPAQYKPKGNNCWTTEQLIPYDGVTPAATQSAANLNNYMGASSKCSHPNRPLPLREGGWGVRSSPGGYQTCMPNPPAAEGERIRCNRRRNLIRPRPAGGSGTSGGTMKVSCYRRRVEIKRIAKIALRALLSLRHNAHGRGKAKADFSPLSGSEWTTGLRGFEMTWG